MQLNNSFTNTYHPNFSANLVIYGNKSLLLDNQVSILKEMLQPLGEKDDIVELNIASDIIDWVEVNNQNHPKKFLSGYKMFVKTSIPEIKDKDLSVADVQQRFWENYSALSPFEVMKKWVKSIKNNSKFDAKSINVNPSLYNFSNEKWTNWVSFKTPDSLPQKPKVDLDKCQNLLNIKIYGDLGYRQIIADAMNDKDKSISSNDIIDSLVVAKKCSGEKIREKIRVADCYNDNVKKEHRQTKESYSNKSGFYVQEREVLHEVILCDIFANFDKAKPKNNEKPTFIMLGGRGGSGKTKFGKDGETKVYDKQNYIVLNSDEIKKRLPEYKGFNSFEVHEESWDILNKAIKLSMEKGLNVVLDGTMSDRHSNEKILKDFSNAGYNIEMYFMYLKREKAAERALMRFDYNNRYVPLDVLLNMKENEQNFDELKKYADKWAFYSNDVELGKEPILINYETSDLLGWLLQKSKLDD